MSTTACTLNLAHRIGLYRIAVTVDRFYDQLESHPGLTDPVVAFGDDPGRRARVTYFWWVSLGGNRVAEMNVDAEPRARKDELPSRDLGESARLFRQVLFSVIDRDLAEAWWKEITRLLPSTRTCNQPHGGTLVPAA